MKQPIFVDEKRAKRSLAVPMTRAHFGQEFIVTRDGKPFAKLVAERANFQPAVMRPGSIRRRGSRPLEVEQG